MKTMIQLFTGTAALAAVLVFVFASCKTKQANNSTIDYTGEPTLVYKTKADYSKNIPVTMNAEKTAILSYPAPNDIYYKTKLAYPTPLVNGYLLDNRGIAINTVFLKLTYSEYAKLEQAPSLDEMMLMITDKDPFTEIYYLGNRGRFKNEVEEINVLIKKGALKKFKRIK
jgi:hypothetical protein